MGKKGGFQRQGSLLSRSEFSGVQGRYPTRDPEKPLRKNHGKKDNKGKDKNTKTTGN